MRLGCRLLLFALATGAMAQQKKMVMTPLEPAQPLERLQSGLGRLGGEDATDGVAYTRVFITGIYPDAKPDSPEAEAARLAAMPGAALDPTLPRLTGECLRDAEGKYSFKLYISFGALATVPTERQPDWRYFPIYHVKKTDLPRDPIHDETLSLQFLGYMKVKPQKLRFQIGIDNPGQFYYDPPALKSHNLEDASFYVRFLRSLPTLRVTDPEGHVVEFLSTAWVAQLGREPLCRARGL